MNKKRVVLLSSLMAVALTGCFGGKSVLKPESKAVVECVFPDAPNQAAPLWICDAPVEGVAVSAVGSHEKSAAGPSFMKDQAAAAARVNLAQQMKVHVTNMIKQYVETTGAAASETVDKVNTSVSKLITAETIVGSRVFRSTTSPNGSVYVLVGLDPSVTKEATEKVLKSSMNNDKALWQQFKAKKGQEELAEEIAKMKVMQ
ncbi:MAG: LPP20 family lipoprotein [Pseudomonadota bacterium]|nr:LPP20 family lipoprotein [Pseudomonadota bacterium]